MAEAHVVIVGGGLAGAKTAEALREEGFDGAITLLAAEDEIPYERPPLSKEFLQGKQEIEDAQVHPASWYEEQHVQLRRGVRAESVDAAAGTVALSTGESLPYTDLVLATGSEPRRPDWPGVEAAGVHVLRTHADAEALREAFGAGPDAAGSGPARRLVCVGGGWIGLEAAASARQAGLDVTVLERSAVPLGKILGDRVAGVFAQLHRDNGVDLRTETSVERILVKDGRATGVRLQDGNEIEADLVLLGLGATPRLETARSAGLEIDAETGGVAVDAALRSSDPHVYAVGDIASVAHPVLGRRLRVEHWATALNQPAVVAKAIVGKNARYTELPYFFSDQFDLGMEYIGWVAPHERVDVVIRGSLEDREFVAFWVAEDGSVKASMNVNIWDVPDAMKPLITECKPVDREALADPEVPLAHL